MVLHSASLCWCERTQCLGGEMERGALWSMLGHYSAWRVIFHRPGNRKHRQWSPGQGVAAGLTFLLKLMSFVEPLTFPFSCSFRCPSEMYSSTRASQADPLCRVLALPLQRIPEQSSRDPWCPLYTTLVGIKPGGWQSVRSELTLHLGSKNLLWLQG